MAERNVPEDRDMHAEMMERLAVERQAAAADGDDGGDDGGGDGGAARGGRKGDRRARGGATGGGRWPTARTRR